MERLERREYVKSFSTRKQDQITNEPLFRSTRDNEKGTGSL